MPSGDWRKIIEINSFSQHLWFEYFSISSLAFWCLWSVAVSRFHSPLKSINHSFIILSSHQIDSQITIFQMHNMRANSKRFVSEFSRAHKLCKLLKVRKNCLIQYEGDLNWFDLVQVRYNAKSKTENVHNVCKTFIWQTAKKKLRKNRRDSCDAAEHTEKNDNIHASSRFTENDHRTIDYCVSVFVFVRSKRDQLNFCDQKCIFFFSAQGKITLDERQNVTM